MTEAYTYVPGTNRLDTADTTAYTYDLNGNITGIGDMVLTYNENNRLVEVVENSNTLGEYTYNGLGQRIIKEVESGVTTTVFHYDFDGNIIGESDIDGTFSKEYIYKGSSRLAMVDVGTGEVYFFGNDSLGTPLIITDSTNTAVWEARYKPFGEAEVNPNSSVVNNFRFPGQYYDSETGLHYNYHRFYNPETGRYLRPDPIGLEGGLNLFLYTNNNPINKIDPEGLIEPGSKEHHPPGWNKDWEWRHGTRGKGGERWFDPKGGEYRWHPPDKHHPEGHWDYNPWEEWNSPWRNIPGEPPPDEPPVPVTPSTKKIPLRPPGPLILIINPYYWCTIDPSLPWCSPCEM